MGVGAIFISSLALYKLPEPNYPPQSQTDLLTVTLQPIVSFVVLGSIIIRMRLSMHRDTNLILFTDGLSIPFFSFGRTVSRTVSLSATLTQAGRRSKEAPDWLLWVPRVPAPAAKGDIERLDGPVAGPSSSSTPVGVSRVDSNDMEVGASKVRFPE